MINVGSLGNPVPLFSGSNLADLLEAHVRDAQQDVQKLAADDLLNRPTEDVISDMFERHHADIPTLKRDQAYLEDPVEIDVRLNDYDFQTAQRGTLLGLVVPFEGPSGMFYVRPNSFGGDPRGNLHYNNLVLTIRGVNLQSEQVGRQFQSMLDQIEFYLSSQRSMVEQFATTFPHRLRHFIEARKKRLLADRNLVSALPFPMKARSDAPKTYVAPIKRKILAVSSPPRTEAPFKPEPVLDEENYKAILGIIHSMTLVIERSPLTFSKMGEETLRDHYLVQLNGQYQGSATGETFNASGKTDILIRVGDKNIFIAECKIWGGPKKLTEALDQILSYLTWRDTKAALIIFNRNKQFSSVLDAIRTTVENHPHKKRGPTVESETQFRYVFGHPSDHNREIILTVMAFDVP